MRLYSLAYVHQSPLQTELLVAVGCFARLFGRRGSYTISESNEAVGEKSVIIPKDGKRKRQKRWWTTRKPLIVERIKDEDISDILSLKNVEKRLEEVRREIPGCQKFEADPDLTRTEMTRCQMEKAAQMLKECSKHESKLNTHQKTCLSAAVQELNLYCLMRGNVNVFGVKPPRSLPERLVKCVLGTIPHGMEPEFYMPFLYTASEKNKEGLSLIYSAFQEALNKLLPGEHLDEVVYPEDLFKNIANKALNTPKELTKYSPEFLRICLKIAKLEKIFFNPKRKKLAAAIQDLIDSVPNTPCETRVDRQINDLCLVLGKNLNLRGALKDKRFEGTDADIAETKAFIEAHRCYAGDIGSAVQRCHTKLKEELNLYCLATGKDVCIDFDRPKLRKELVVDVIGKELRSQINSEILLQQCLATAYQPGSNRFLIRRTLEKILAIQRTTDDNGPFVTNSAQDQASQDLNSAQDQASQDLHSAQDQASQDLNSAQDQASQDLNSTQDQASQDSTNEQDLSNIQSKSAMEEPKSKGEKEMRFKAYWQPYDEIIDQMVKKESLSIDEKDRRQMVMLLEIIPNKVQNNMVLAATKLLDMEIGEARRHGVEIFKQRALLIYFEEKLKELEYYFQKLLETNDIPSDFREQFLRENPALVDARENVAEQEKLLEEMFLEERKYACA